MATSPWINLGMNQRLPAGAPAAWPGTGPLSNDIFNKYVTGGLDKQNTNTNDTVEQQSVTEPLSEEQDAILRKRFEEIYGPFGQSSAPFSDSLSNLEKLPAVQDVSPLASFLDNTINRGGTNYARALQPSDTPMNRMNAMTGLKEKIAEQQAKDVALYGAFTNSQLKNKLMNKISTGNKVVEDPNKAAGTAIDLIKANEPKAVKTGLSGAQLQNKLESLSKRLQSLPEMRNSLAVLKQYVDDPTKDIPGYGKTGLLPDWATSDAGLQVRQAFKDLANMKIQMITGQAGSDVQAKRIMDSWGIGSIKNDKTLREGMKKAIQDTHSTAKQIYGGYLPEVKQAFSAQVGYGPNEFEKEFGDLSIAPKTGGAPKSPAQTKLEKLKAERAALGD